MKNHEKLILAMMDFDAGHPGRIQHFLKVLGFAELIARLEGLDEKTLFTLQAAAVTHDIGIGPSKEKHGSGVGNYQQIEGPPAARPMLEALGYEADVIERVCYLIAHHHTYTGIDGIDYQILVEADFLVNIYEGDMPAESAQKVRQNIFTTESGKEIFDKLYPKK